MLYSDIDVIMTRVVQVKKIVQEYKVITSVAVHPTFQLRELFVCFSRLNLILDEIGDISV